MDAQTGFLRLWLDSLVAMLRDKGAVLLLLGAPVLYGFFYPWFYSSEVVQRVPVAVVVQDNSGLARQMLRFAQASPRIHPQLVTADEGEARAAVLRGEVGKDEPLDMLVTNYVYDKVGKRNKHVVNFRHAMEPGKRLTWDDLGHFGLTEYILMHALIYRTAVVRESKMQLPEHTFYVDFIYAYQPFPWVKSLQYVDTPFYHYFIGRDGQSVQTDVMIRRVDQLRLVNQCMVRATPERGTVPDGLYRYMIHFLAIQSSVASVFMILSRDPENYEKKKAMWADIEAYSPTIYKDVRKKAMSRALNLHGSLGRFVIRKGYFVAEHVVGFN